MTSSLPSATGLARCTLAAQHPLTRQWCSDDTARLARLAEDHELDVRLAVDLELAAQRAALAPGHEPEELLNRWVAASPELSALLSIRFQGGDAAKPFVDASVLSRPLADGDLPALGTAAVRVFGSFEPRYLRLWSAKGTDAFAGTRRDKRFLAAPLRDLTVSSRVPIPFELSLRAATDLTHWDDAAAAYAAVDGEHPEHPGQARIQEADDLQQSVAAGTLSTFSLAELGPGGLGRPSKPARRSICRATRCRRSSWPRDSADAATARTSLASWPRGFPTATGC